MMSVLASIVDAMVPTLQWVVAIFIAFVAGVLLWSLWAEWRGDE